jgi:hypothetical protein
MPILTSSTVMMPIVIVIATILMPVIPVFYIHRCRATVPRFIKNRWWRRRIIYWDIIHRTFAVDRESNIHVYISPRITIAAQEHECDNHYPFHLVLLSGAVRQ